MIKVSVIMPVYNTKEYLSQSLDCIINQTLEDIEIICVNDGSTDGSDQILENYANKYSRIILINQNNAGQSVARNVALKTATGKYVYFMDSDDILIATALENCWTLSEQEQLDVLYFSGNTFYENQKLENKRTDFYQRYLRKGNYPDVLNGIEMLVEQRKNQDYIVSTCLQFIRREFLNEQNINFHDGIIHEDNLFGFSVMMKAQRARCISEIYFYRRVREESVMTKKENCRNLFGYYTCLIQQMKLASELTCTDEQIDYILGVLRGLLYHVKRLYFTIEKNEIDLFLKRCDPWERYLFETIIVTDLTEIAKLRHIKLQEPRLNSEKSQRNIDSAVNMSIPKTILKKVKTCYRIFKKSGVQGIMQVIKEKKYFG